MNERDHPDALLLDPPGRRSCYEVTVRLLTTAILLCGALAGCATERFCDCANPGQASLVTPQPVLDYTTSGEACDSQTVTVCIQDAGPAGGCGRTALMVPVVAPGRCSIRVMLVDGTSLTASTVAALSTGCCAGLYAGAFRVEADAGP
jgi:hypothetical protein